MDSEKWLIEQGWRHSPSDCSLQSPQFFRALQKEPGTRIIVNPWMIMVLASSRDGPEGERSY